MEKISLNNEWRCHVTGDEAHSFCVSLPHDAMLLDERNSSSRSGINNGWFVARNYTYERDLVIPENTQQTLYELEFEGVYHNATVYVNGVKAAFHAYGYTGFRVSLNEYLRFGDTNQITVSVKNDDQPNSRWYSGTGIYRPVWLIKRPGQHILPDGIRVTTMDYHVPMICVEVTANFQAAAQIQITDGQHVIKEVITEPGKKDGDHFCMRAMLKMPGAKLWDTQRPNLYHCSVTCGDDTAEVSFGIRQLAWNAGDGFLINGKREILRGACIHHDNGLLGACAYDDAEERKIRILKENGYNAIRSAHNPCSKAMLDACDRLGVLVMDEYVDVWYIHKTKFDYADQVMTHYQEDLAQMVEKDYNHPSVILYSTGNEVSETAQKKGIAFCGTMTQYLHELDATRPVSCGINIFFNLLSSLGFGVYSDKKADQEFQNEKKRKAVGSEFFNRLAGLLGANFMKAGASLKACDLKTRGAYANLDIAGYNYGLFRYRKDLRHYPERLILGSETFCSDAAAFWKMAQDHPRLIGDFVWSGMDYLGEVGVGSWEYPEYAPDPEHGPGWVSAGSGRIDLTGKPLAEMTYTQVAFGLKKIGLGVIPVNHTHEKHSPSAWKMTNAIESWSWNGCAGQDARVEIYSLADSVSLFLNGTCLGTKKTKKSGRTIFSVTYQDGTLEAVSYDQNHQETARCALCTAGKGSELRIEPEQTILADAQKLCYARIRITDHAGILKPMLRDKVRLTVEGGSLLGYGSACPYNQDGFLTDTADTYFGEAMAIIRPDRAGKMVIRAAGATGSACAEVEVR